MRNPTIQPSKARRRGNRTAASESSHSSQRHSWRLAIACLYGTATVLFCLQTTPIFSAFAFGALQALLLHACFRWYAKPVYGGTFNYASPLAIFNSLSFVYYGFGNCIAFVFPEGMYFHNSGAEDHYIAVLSLAVAGAYGVDASYRMTSRLLRENKRDHPSRVAIDTFVNSLDTRLILNIIAVVSIAAVLYCVNTYHVTTVHQIAGIDAVDNIVILSARGLLGIAVVAVTQFYFRKPGAVRAVATLMVLILLAPATTAFASRIMLFGLIFSGYFVVITIRGAARLGTTLVLVLALAVGWLVIRTVKDLRPLTSGGDAETAVLQSSVVRSSSIDFGYRLAGLDFPAAIWDKAIEHGVQPMFGREALISSLGVVPNILWPGKHVADAEDIINDHYSFTVPDQLMSPLPAACADVGMLASPILLSALGAVLCLSQFLMLRAFFGLPLYLCSLPYLFSFEAPGTQYVLFWLRFAFMLWAVAQCLGWLVHGHGRRTPYYMERTQ